MTVDCASGCVDSAAAFCVATVFRAEGRWGIAGAPVAADVAGAVVVAEVLVVEDVGGVEGEVIDAAVMPARSQGFGGDTCAIFLVFYRWLGLWALSLDRVWRRCARG